MAGVSPFLPDAAARRIAWEAISHDGVNSNANSPWIKPACRGVGAAAPAGGVGFQQLGWRTAGSSRRAVQQHAPAAVVTARVPFCVAVARQGTNAAERAKFRLDGSPFARGEKARAGREAPSAEAQNVLE